MIDIARERSYSTPYADSPWLPLLLLSLASQKYTPTSKTQVRSSYDFVIVGAGSGGSVVANRLSEVPCVTVLILEAGAEPPTLSEVPVLGGSTFVNTDIDWQYRTVPQLYTGGGFVDRKITWPRGKTFGGCTILHGDLYSRGNKQNYDDWAEDGAEGWSYEEVLPYFKKMEDNQNIEYISNGFHGVGGPMTVDLPKYHSEIRQPLFDAYRTTLGYYMNKDPDGPYQLGTCDQEATLRNGQRCSTAKAYLVPSDDRENLDIVGNARVVKVVLDDHRAVGVLYDLGGRRYFVEAKREVILSAGSTNTPQLLMLSGIGPADELIRHNIPVVADLMVGYNLHDHCENTVSFELSDEIPSVDEKFKDTNVLFRYINGRTGFLTSTAAIAMTGFLKSSFSDPESDVPDFQIYFHEANAEGLKKIYGLTSEVYDQVYAPYENKTLANCQVILLTPETRGRIRLQSSNPYDPPIIDLQYLKEWLDFERLVEGMKICHVLGTSPAMRSLGSKPFTTLLPGCEHLAKNQDSYFRCQARMISSTNHHHVGTARMGDRNHPATVVDPQLRVITIPNLRVVDASVIPTIPTGNTNIPVIMIAEKASDMIKDTIKC